MIRHEAVKHAQSTENTKAVVFLTGVDRLSLDAVSFSLSDTSGSAAVITYDVHPNGTAESGLDVIRSVGRASGFATSRDHGGETLVMDDCCLTCAVKHDLALELQALGASTREVVVTLPIGVEGTPVAQYLEEMSQLRESNEGAVHVSAIANTVGLDGFEERLFDDDHLCLYGTDDGGLFEERSIGAVSARLIHEATHVFELPLVGFGCLARHAYADRECRCQGIIRALACDAAVIYPDANEVALAELTAQIQTVAAAAR